MRATLFVAMVSIAPTAPAHGEESVRDGAARSDPGRLELDPLELDPLELDPLELEPLELDPVQRERMQGSVPPDPVQDAAARRHFEDGLRHYEAEAFKAARDDFEEALALSPGSADYHHWLGKAYGRLAERANPFSALAYATLARERFEQAVALDGENRPALVSLMEYYEEAPGFLGGSKRKAAELRARIDALDAVRPPAPTRDIEPD